MGTTAHAHLLARMPFYLLLTASWLAHPSHLQAYASYSAPPVPADQAAYDAWLAAFKQGAIDKYNADLANNWRRLSCTPKEGVRIVCQNTWSPDNWVMVFDADCGEAAGTATIQVCSRVLHVAGHAE
jgi:hypothetical protein